MLKRIAVGTDDFKEIIENDCLFIDKSLFVKEVVDDPSSVILFPRPRRFGKTLNMSMLRYYFDNTMDSKYLFQGLKITKCGDKYLEEMNKYPVISLTLKNLKASTYEEFIENYKILMQDLYSNYLFIKESSKILESDKEYFKNILNEKENNITIALSRLVKLLKLYYGENVIVLLDEYDAPILSGYLNGYYKEIITFMKQVFVTTFKNNLNLKKGVITGILRVSKENMFSDANNINVYNITDGRYSSYFGFTESEVKETLEEYNLSSKFNEVKSWYDGYLFDDNVIYNPWSIIGYLSNERHLLKSYWVNTGGVDLLKNLIYNLENPSSLLSEFHHLIERGEVEDVDLDLYMDLNNLKGNRNTIWTLFMLSGYLTPKDLVENPKHITLRIPNYEIKENLESIASNWFRSGSLEGYNVTDYLITNNMEEFISSFERIVEKSFSYYDVPENSNGENFYHAFVMGLLYSSNNYYEITSNKESGYGRYDLILKPKRETNYAYVIEFKLVKDNDFKKTIEEAFKQIEEKDYANAIKEYEVTKVVIAFKGKKVLIETR